MTNFKIILITLLSVELANGAKILAVFPSDVKSHFVLGKVVLTELANRGHEITFFSQFSLREKHKNISEIRLAGVKESLAEKGLEEENHLTARNERSKINSLTHLINRATALVDYTLDYPVLQDTLQKKDEYDLLIIDMYLTDALLGLAYYLDIPSVVLCSSGTNKWANEMVGNPHNPSYNPNQFLGFTDKMSIKQRLINSLVSAFEKITYNYMYLPAQEMVYRRVFKAYLPDKNLPPLINIIHNVSLVLVNTHPIFQYPRPIVPNMVQVGGLHINSDKSETIAAEIFDYIQAAPDGVIYISLGSQVKSHDLPSDQISAFVKVFKSYIGKMRIIWKWENATLIDHPYNVIVGPTVPQQAILAHQNVKLFITNGGLMSLMEAVYFEKPVIVLPIFGDQDFNGAQVESNGYGRVLSLQNITEDSIQDAINEILTNQNYLNNVKRLSKLFKDNPINPLDYAVYSIEYV
ncbi:UDP-glycosyltransferase UGT5 [Pseudolycoriella hygida]|uniref:UDP-glycosyltransferase UGT5 n=1 Tax=Pseudolycoriella hygida TaxID=35572 RepID=A0A9Q0NCN3_9DIPT|nr:UDP-glycosyltransferase UGT5 [Pseudolycoriella hygida]